jgi:hypothetical protein
MTSCSIPSSCLPILQPVLAQSNVPSSTSPPQTIHHSTSTLEPNSTPPHNCHYTRTLHHPAPTDTWSNGMTPQQYSRRRRPWAGVGLCRHSCPGSAWGGCEFESYRVHYFWLLCDSASFCVGYRETGSCFRGWLLPLPMRSRGFLLCCGQPLCRKSTTTPKA